MDGEVCWNSKRKTSRKVEILRRPWDLISQSNHQPLDHSWNNFGVELRLGHGTLFQEVDVKVDSSLMEG